MTLRNEDPERAILRLRDGQGQRRCHRPGRGVQLFPAVGHQRADVAAAEQAAADALAKARSAPTTAIIYRRRTVNTGYKAGNVRDFCERWGRDLRADAAARRRQRDVRRHDRAARAHDAGPPARSASCRASSSACRRRARSRASSSSACATACAPTPWARLVGRRLRPVLGHNAVVRIKPFANSANCRSCPASRRSAVTCSRHDQVEATLMRRAGYEVRVLPVENGSWEENPPTMLDFAKRDVRWCQGNMQYVKLLDLPGLYADEPLPAGLGDPDVPRHPGVDADDRAVADRGVSGARAWRTSRSGLAIFLYVVFFTMYLMPKIAGLIDAMLTKGGMARYGGPLRFAASAALEIVFSFLQGAVSTIRTTIFMIGLAFGKSVVWGGQIARRLRHLVDDGDREPLAATAVRRDRVRSAARVSPAAFWWSLPLTAGYLLAMPFAVLTASPAPGPAVQALRAERHPRRFRSAEGSRSSAGEGSRLCRRARIC